MTEHSLSAARGVILGLALALALDILILIALFAAGIL
jgi:hypothetical protein